MLLITGYKGFIGQHLCKMLTKKGIAYIGYDLQDGNDVRNKFKLDDFFHKYQVTEVIHLAALAGVRKSQEFPQEYISTNIEGTQNVVSLCEKYNIKHLIFYSSSSVYGRTTPPVSEAFVKKPISLYGITKLAGELIVGNSNIQQTTTVVPFTVYGENGRRDEVVYRWLEQYKNNLPITIYGNGTSERGYVNVHDLVEATIKILIEKAGHWTHETFNLGGFEVIKLSQIIDIFKELIPEARFENLPNSPADPHSNFADTAKAQRELEFFPQAKFEANLRKIIKSEI